MSHLLVIGISTEGPVAMVLEACQELEVAPIMLDQREHAQVSVSMRATSSGVSGYLSLAGRTYDLDEISGIYARMVDVGSLPEFVKQPGMTAERLRAERVSHLLTEWLEVTDAKVFNRHRAMASNNSKPYQAQIIQACGFQTPETLITNSPERVCEFLEVHQKVIYKSISGVRSIVRTLDNDVRGRLDSIRWCPTQFQAYVPGQDVRVHVVDDQVFATLIRTTGIDYRYAGREEDGRTELEAVELDEWITEKCIRLAHRLGLPFAGIDLKVTPDQDVYCFEVNPSPGFSYYQAHTGQPIAQTVVRTLTSPPAGSVEPAVPSE